MRGNSTFDASRRNSHYCVYAITYNDATRIAGVVYYNCAPQVSQQGLVAVFELQNTLKILPLPSDGFSRVRSLNPVATMSFAIPENWEQEIKYDHDGDFFECQIRQRTTRDRGRSRNNKIKSRSKMF